MASIRPQEFDLAQSRFARRAANIPKNANNSAGYAVSPREPGYRDHDKSNQWWLGARRDNRSVALDLVTVGGRWVGAAGYRFRILDALHKAGLCHSTLQSRDRDCPRRRDGGHWICCRVRIRRPVELVSQAIMS